MATSSVPDRLYAAYSFVRAQERNKSISAVTLDHLIQERLDQIQAGESRALLNSAGASTSKKPSLLARLDDMEKAIEDVGKSEEATA